MTLDDARAFVARARWQAAKAPARGVAHEYSLDEWNDQAEFEAFKRLVAEHGYRERWADGHRYAYLNLDGYRLWFTPAVFGPGWIVNRQPLDDEQLQLEVES
jgi:hypothetical protein